MQGVSEYIEILCIIENLKQTIVSPSLLNRGNFIKGLLKVINSGYTGVWLLNRGIVVEPYTCY